MTRSALPRSRSSTLRSRVQAVEEPAAALERVRAPRGVLAADQDVVGGLEEQQRRATARAALGEVGLERVEERARADVDHDRDRLLRPRGSGRRADDVGQQAGRHVVDDVEAEVLQLLGGGAAARAGHAGDHDQLAGAGSCGHGSSSSISSPVAVLTARIWPRAGTAARRASLIAVAVRWPMPGTRASSSTRGGAQLLQGAEVLEQGLAPHLAQPRDVVEQALDHRLRAPRRWWVIANRCASSRTRWSR